MATENQLQFVSDIETAVKAMTQDKQPVGVTISEVCEYADRNIHESQALIERLCRRNEIGLLKRLQAAFAVVSIKQATIEKKLASLELGNEASADEFKLDPVIPPVEVRTVQTVRKPLRDETAQQQPNAGDIEVVAKVLRILDPLPKSSQRRIVNTMTAYLGVGE